MRVFVSYSRKDATAAGQLVADLEKASLSAWHDHELHGGDPWWQDILQHIRNCDVFVLALSDNVLASKPCMAELGYARALGLPIVPVQIGPVGNIRATPGRHPGTRLHGAHGRCCPLAPGSDLRVRRGASSVAGSSSASPGRPVRVPRTSRFRDHCCGTVSTGTERVRPPTTRMPGDGGRRRSSR